MTLNDDIVHELMPHAIALNQISDVASLIERWQTKTVDNLKGFMNTAYRHRHWEVHRYLKIKLEEAIAFGNSLLRSIRFLH